ncbi:uracil-DNA glycosylase family protein [Zavarzinia compransoris]|uniref:Uracil-DNA glycosylase n=1 Tax=Zavarzinia compransoris TaxID=1264899 RepID=A0A317E9C1_9PROT|nr:uracil-DNA glycosylase family protein [Zavarzinia compransoris]PWR23698.1 uracil-DNA glycosylase [Zavarzinia compransoris]TDP47918.1 uracil-DNA glycosylase [Zavarzinia compransoris]
MKRSGTEQAFDDLLAEIRACRLCAADLPAGPRPVVRGRPGARLLIVGQAPGRRVHETGIPFNDPSGDRLRDWLGIDRATFYDEARIAILPMGFCYPGTAPKQGDLPPRPECAPLWRRRLLDGLPRIELTLAIGAYAQAWHLGERREATLGATVRRFREFLPALLPLPHPSPRNNLWLRKNPWFEQDVIPELRRRVADLLGSP